LVLFSGIVAGGLAAWVPASALPSLLRPIAIIFHDPRFADLADLVSSTPGVVIIGGLIVTIAAVTTVQANTLLRTLLTAGFIFGIISWIIIIWSLSSADGPNAFRTAWDHFMTATGPYGSFDKRVPLAMAAGMSITNSPWEMTLGGLIMGFWIYYGYYIPTFFAEEVRKPRTTLVIAAISSLVFAYIIFVTAAFLLERLVPTDWIAAEGYLENNKDAVSAVAGGRAVVAMPWITFYAAILKPEPLLIFFVAFGWIFTLINLVQTYLFYTSRIIYSWALDRALPGWVLGNPGRESFARAIFLTSVLAGVGLVDAAFGGPLGTQLKFAFFAVVTGLIPIFALTFLPKLHPEIFGRLPSFLKRSVFAIPLASYVGVGTLVYLIWMIIASFLYPAVGVENPLATLTILAVMIVIGFVMFAAMRRRRLAAESIDILQTYKAPISEDPNDLERTFV